MWLHKNSITKDIFYATDISASLKNIICKNVRIARKLGRSVKDIQLVINAKSGKVSGSNMRFVCMAFIATMFVLLPRIVLLHFGLRCQARMKKQHPESSPFALQRYAIVSILPDVVRWDNLETATFPWWSGSIGNFSAMPTYEHLGVLICRCWEKVVVIFGDLAKIRGWHVWLDGFSIYFSQVTNRQQTALTFWTKSWDVTFRKINTHCKL